VKKIYSHKIKRHFFIDAKISGLHEGLPVFNSAEIKELNKHELTDSDLMKIYKVKFKGFKINWANVRPDLDADDIKHSPLSETGKKHLKDIRKILKGKKNEK